MPHRAFFSLTRENEGFDSGDREICAGSIHARGNNVTYVGWDSQEGRFARVSSKKIKGERREQKKTSKQLDKPILPAIKEPLLKGRCRRLKASCSFQSALKLFSHSLLSILHSLLRISPES